MKTDNFPKSSEKIDKEIEKMMSLLRRVYDVIEMSHLNDHKMIDVYCANIKFPRQLGDDIFGYLQSKDQTFRDTVIKRQVKWRNKNKYKKCEHDYFIDSSVIQGKDGRPVLQHTGICKHCNSVLTEQQLRDGIDWKDLGKTIIEKEIK